MSNAFIIIDDGPCAGARINAAQAPIMLRVTRTDVGLVDCLDEATDVPKPGEQVYVYRASGRPSVAFVDGVDPKTKRRFGYQSRTQHYVLHEPQPGSEHVMTWAAWSKWCEANKAELVSMYEATCVPPSKVARP